MNGKQQIVTRLEEMKSQWETFVTRLSEIQRVTPPVPGIMSVKDTLGHLMAWQQVSIARLEAANQKREPRFPSWLEGLDPESEEDRETFNANIQALYESLSWEQMYAAWNAGFRTFLTLAAAIPVDEMIDKQRYPWLKGYALYNVLEGSYHHHLEHIEELYKVFG
jgi:hypothetical protein